MQLSPCSLPKINELQQFLGHMTVTETISSNMWTLLTHSQELRKDKLYICTDKCQDAFKELKRCLQKPPIHFFPDPRKPYCLFKDATKY